MKYLILAIQFLTRIPLPLSVEVSEEKRKYVIFCFPLVGLIIGAFLYLVALPFVLWERGWSIGAFLVLLLWVALTGAMHLDGLSDTMDGFFSNRSRERVLEIMADPVTGTFGNVAMMLVLLGKWIGIFLLLPHLPTTLLFIPMVSRMMASLLIAYTNPAKPGGMGAYLQKSQPQKEVLWSGLLLASMVFHGAWVVAFLSAALTTLWMARKANKIIGGTTGDVYGATVELTECIQGLVVSLWVLYI